MQHYYFKAEVEGTTFYIDEWAKNEEIAMMMAKNDLNKLWDLDEDVIADIELEEY